MEYREQMHPDLPAPGTRLRGYVQIDPTGTGVPLTTANGLTKDIVDAQGNPVFGVTKPHYLGPLILSTGCDPVVGDPGCTPRPVRIKFTNYLPTGPGGDLFIPTDTTYMGAGMGPGGSISSVAVSGRRLRLHHSTPGWLLSRSGGSGAAATASRILMAR